MGGATTGAGFWHVAVGISETMVGAATGSRTAPKGGSVPEPLLCILLSLQSISLPHHEYGRHLCMLLTWAIIDKSKSR